MDSEDRKHRQYFEQGWMLGVVGQIVVEDGQSARRHVDGLVECR